MVKYNLILDLDGTILQSVNFPSWYYDESSRHLFPLVGLSMPLVLNQNEIAKKPSTPPEVRQVFFRPYLMNFLDYCFSKFNVTIWTNSTKNYCMPILEFLEIDHKCKHIFVRKFKKQTNINNFNKTENQLHEYHELKTGKKVKMGMQYRNVFKPINLLWQTKEFTKQYNPNNTFIIDDLGEMFIQFPNNTMLIPGWCHLNWSDDNLKVIIDELEKYFNSKKRKSIKDMCQLINLSFRQDLWQEINSGDCQSVEYKPEFYYKKSITKKNQKLLLKQEKVGVEKNYKATTPNGVRGGTPRSSKNKVSGKNKVSNKNKAKKKKN